jgi:hypothetical protein
MTEPKTCSQCGKTIWYNAWTVDAGCSGWPGILGWCSCSFRGIPTGGYSADGGARGYTFSDNPRKWRAWEVSA